MKRLLFIIYFLALIAEAAVLPNRSRSFVAGLQGGGAAVVPTYLIKQNFEGGSPPWDNGETWTTNGAGIVWYATPALEGTNSIKVDASAATCYFSSQNFTSNSTVYAYFMMNP